MQPDKIGTGEDLALYRIDTAKEDLKSAKILRDASCFKGANNRAYYAIFHAINAIHALNGVAYKKYKDARRKILFEELCIKSTLKRRYFQRK